MRSDWLRRWAASLRSALAIWKSATLEPEDVRKQSRDRPFSKGSKDEVVSGSSRTPQALFMEASPKSNSAESMVAPCRANLLAFPNHLLPRESSASADSSCASGFLWAVLENRAAWTEARLLISLPWWLSKDPDLVAFLPPSEVALEKPPSFLRPFAAPNRECELDDLEREKEFCGELRWGFCGILISMLSTSTVNEMPVPFSIPASISWGLAVPDMRAVSELVAREAPAELSDEILGRAVESISCTDASDEAAEPPLGVRSRE